MEDEIREATSPETNDTPEVPEVTEVPTAEQQMETLQAHLKARDSELSEVKKSIQGLRGSLYEKDKKLKEQAELRDEVDTLKGMIKVLAASQYQGYQVSEDELETVAKKHPPDVDKIFADLDKQREEKAKQRKIESQREEYAQKALAVYQRAGQVFKDNDAALLRVERLLDKGLLEEAEGKVADAESKAPQGETKVESDEEKKKKWIEEGKRLAMEESLKTDTGSPQGSVGGITLEKFKKMSPGERMNLSSEDIAKLPLGI